MSVSPLKKLASQTAIYGFSTILVRVLNYLLAPLHTRVFTDQADYGIISEMYAYVTFINVVCMFGLETAYFRFASNNSNSLGKNKVFSTAQISLLVSTILFVGYCTPESLGGKLRSGAKKVKIFGDTLF